MTSHLQAIFDSCVVVTISRTEVRTIRFAFDVKTADLCARVQYVVYVCIRANGTYDVFAIFGVWIYIHIYVYIIYRHMVLTKVMGSYCVIGIWFSYWKLLILIRSSRFVCSLVISWKRVTVARRIFVHIAMNGAMANIRLMIFDIITWKVNEKCNDGQLLH